MNFTLHYPQKLIFGENSVCQLGENVKQLGRRCLLVTGAKSTSESGALAAALTSLAEFGLDVVKIINVNREPDCAVVDKIRQIITAQRVEIVIGIGGGSPLDAAKAAAGLAGLPGPTEIYLNGQSFIYQGVAFVAVPTTAGTGSEVTLNAVLYNPATDNKTSIAHPGFQARAGIVDPALTWSMPPPIAAATGMDALTHAIESYTSKAANPITRALAAKAIQLVGSGLLRALHGDLVARTDLALGSMTAAMAFANTGVGLAHAISHPLGAFFDISHGVANALLLPAVLEYNRPSCPEAFCEIGQLLNGTDDAATAVTELLTQLPIPQSLSAAGYKSGREDDLVEKVFQSRSYQKNPRLADKDDILKLIKQCL